MSQYIIWVCQNCKKEIKVKDTKKNRNKKFCSIKCKALHQTGKKFSDEINKKKGRSGKENGFYGKTHTKKQKKIWREQLIGKSYEELYGNDKAQEMRLNLSEKLSGKNNPFYEKHHTNESRKLMSDKKAKLIADGFLCINNSRNSYKGFHFSTKNNEKFYYDSAFEKFRMEQLDEDDSVLLWTKKHGIKIPYEIPGKIMKNFVPDFLIQYKNEKVLEEVKGYDPKKKYKKNAMKLYCENNELQFRWIEELDGYRSWLEKFKEMI